MKLATLPGADIVLIAIVGTAGLQPALAAIRAGKDIAIASKEILVMAGEIVMSEARKYGVRVLAVDSDTRRFSSASTANRPHPSANSGSPLPAGRSATKRTGRRKNFPKSPSSARSSIRRG